MSTLETHSVTKIRALHDCILVKDMNFHERLTTGGILLPGDDKMSEGIRPRWAEVFAVGPKQKDVKVGQFILIKHGRWTRGATIDYNGEELVMRRVDNDDILLVSDDPQVDDTFSGAVTPVSDRHAIHGSLHNG